MTQSLEHPGAPTKLKNRKHYSVIFSDLVSGAPELDVRAEELLLLAEVGRGVVLELGLFVLGKRTTH